MKNKHAQIREIAMQLVRQAESLCTHVFLATLPGNDKESRQEYAKDIPDIIEAMREGISDLEDTFKGCD